MVLQLVTVIFLGSIGLVSPWSVAAEPTEPQTPYAVPVDADGVQRATIMLDSYSYSPRHLIVQAGKPVELTLKSETFLTPHNFIIKELSIEEDVSAGDSVVISFTPMKPGSFTIYCDKRLWPFPSHREKGMEGTLEVR